MRVCDRFVGDGVVQVDPVRGHQGPAGELVDGDGGIDELAGEAALHDLDRVA